MRIDNINGNNISNKGYLDKSVMKYFEKTQKNVHKNISRFYVEDRHVEDFKQLTKLMSSTLILLQDFVEKLHPQTALKIKQKKFSGFNDFYFENSKTGSMVKLYGNDLSTPFIDESNSTPYYSKFVIEKVKNWAISLTKHSPDVDSLLFEQMICEMKNDAKDLSIFGSIKNIINSKKADKLAPEFGAEPIYTNMFAEIRNKAKETSIIDKNNKHEIDKISEDFSVYNDALIKNNK